MDVRISGIVKRYHNDRGWGLIFTYPTDGSIPIKWFFHFTEILSGTPQIGCVATFMPGPPRSAADLPTAKQVAIGEMTVRYSGVSR
jgi:hypothetical protein